MNKIIETALKRFKLAEDAEHDIRKESLSDLKFRAGEQWDAAIKTARNDPLAPRPCLTINRLPQFIRQVTNDARMNRPSIKVSATDDATVETAEILEGMCRHIQVQSNADIAYDTACDNQVTMGFGYIRIITEYCYDDSFDQDIRIKRVKNPFTVYFDPSAVEPDYSDAKWCFVVCDMTKDEFQAEYPGKVIPSSDDWESIGDNISPWGTEDTIRVAEYFEVEETKATLHQLSDGSVTDQEPPKDAAMMGMPTSVNKRETTKKKIIWRKITAAEVLETLDWPGKYIPIVPVLGDDLDIDGKRQLVGMVRYAKDPQRQYNYWSSAQTEAIALAPKAPFVGAEGQFEGYEKFWDSANTKNYSRLVYKPVSLLGQPVPPPQRQQAEPPVQAMVQAIAQASEDLKNTTGIHDASLGSRSNETSGKAIMARQKEGDVSNFHYIDNLSRAIRHVGVILLDLIPKIYDAPRVIRIVHEDQTDEMVKINQPTGEKDANGVEKIYDVTTGRYDVVVEVGPSFSTKREQAADSMIQITQAYPALMQIAGDILIKNLDWPGADDVAERMKKMLPPPLQDKPDGQPELPPQVQQQMAQSAQMIEQLTQTVHQLQDQIDEKSAELRSREKIAAENNETRITVAEIQNNMKAFSEELNHMREHNKMGMQQDQAEKSAALEEANAEREAAAPPELSEPQQ